MAVEDLRDDFVREAQEYAQQQRDKELGRYAAGDYTVDPSKYSGDHAASNLSAALKRAQWNDWMARFAPQGEQLANDIRSGARLDEALGGVTKSVNRSFDIGEGTRNRRMGRYGVQLTGQGKKAADTGFGLRKAATEAASRNWARKAVEKGDRELMGGM